MVELFARSDYAPFIARWRQHFLDAMQPTFLPAGWDVQGKASRNFGKHSVFGRDGE